MPKEYLELLLDSYQYWTKEKLCENYNQLDEENFIIASHSSIPDLSDRLKQGLKLEDFSLKQEPIFIYGNQAALDLWELSLDEFTQFPSSQTAEFEEQAQRQELLEQVEQNGYISNYSGIRVTSKGRRFRIEDAVVWQVITPEKQVIGQAVKFEKWHYLSS